jgi:V/A-type H+-transporting ATPase subunit C
MIEIIVFVLALIAALMAGVLISSRKSMKYLYCNATVSTWEAKLISEARFSELADASNLNVLLSGLEETEYGPLAAEAKKSENPDLVKIERGLHEHLNSKYIETLKMLPEERKKTVERLLGRADVWNLKAVVTMIHNNVPKELRAKELIPSPTTPKERTEMLASAGSIEELLEFLKGSEYYDAVSKSSEEYKDKGLSTILAAVDRQYYSSLWADARAKKAQKKILEPVVGYQIDSLNMKTILRLKKEGASAQDIASLLIRPSHELTDPMFREMIMAGDVRSAVHMAHITAPAKALTDVMTQVEEDGLPTAEKALDEFYLKLCKWFGFTQFFSIAPVLSYLAQKENEVKNLRTVIRLKAEGVEPQEIKETITRVPKIEL